MRRFYHWTARRFVGAIRAKGLTIGALLVSMSPHRFLRTYIWLTTNGTQVQEWAQGPTNLEYRRDEVRLTVEIPDDVQLLAPVDWERLMEPETVNTLTEFGDPENWYVFHGKIPGTWITEARAKKDCPRR